MLGMLVEIYVVLHFTVGGLWWFMCNYVCRLFMSTSLRYIKIFKLDLGHSHHMLRCTTWSPCCQWHDHMTLAWCQRHQKKHLSCSETCPTRRVPQKQTHRWKLVRKRERNCEVNRSRFIISYGNFIARTNVLNVEPNPANPADLVSTNGFFYVCFKLGFLETAVHAYCPKSHLLKTENFLDCSS